MNGTEILKLDEEYSYPKNNNNENNYEVSII